MNVITSTRIANNWLFRVSSLLGFTILTGCHPVVDIEPTLASIQTHVFDTHCSLCHGAANPIHGVDLSSGRSLDNLLYVTSFMEPSFNLIEAGDPDNSLLVRKLEATAETAAMPFPPWPLIPKYKREAVRTWIANMQPVPQPTLTYLQKNLFDVSCATSNCHSGSNASAGLDLSAGNSLVNMFGIPSSQSPTFDLIEPGDPANSYLMKKLDGTGTGVRMPIGKPPLSADILAAVSGWIVNLRGPQPNIDWIQENIYDVSCAYSGCHDGTVVNLLGNVISNVDLRRNVAETNTVNVPSIQMPSLNLITPGDANASYLMKKIEGSADIRYERMPWSPPPPLAPTPPLSQEKIDVVRLYINNMGQPPVAPEPTLASIQTKVFDVSCATGGCHDNVSSISGLDLSAGNAYASLVNVTSGQARSLKLVDPGLPDSSYLIHKLEGTSAAGSQMPPAQPALPQDFIAAIRQCISTL